MNLENMEVVNTRISDAVAAGRLDPDQVPANLEDIKAFKPQQKKAFFEAVYPGPVTEEIAAMLQAGKQLPEEDLQLLRMMPVSQGKALPQILQDAISSNTPLQVAIDNLQDALHDVVDTICKEAGIDSDEYHMLMQTLLDDMDKNPDMYNQFNLDSDPSGLSRLLRYVKFKNRVHAYKPPDKFFLLIDKVSNEITKHKGDVSNLPIDVTRTPKEDDKKGKIPTKTYLSITFNMSDINIPPQITFYDLLVYFAMASLYVSGNEYVTATEIYKGTGGQGNPNRAQIKKIMKSVEKMMTTLIVIDNREEVKNYNFDYFYEKQNMLYAKIEAAILGGRTTKEAIHILAEPIISRHARLHDQLARVPIICLQTGSKTDTTAALELYLLYRIAKYPKLSRKIVYNTIYEETGLNPQTAKEIHRIKTHIYRILTHYKDCKHIMGFRMLDDGIKLQIIDKHIIEDDTSYKDSTNDEIRYGMEYAKKSTGERMGS